MALSMASTSQLCARMGAPARSARGVQPQQPVSCAPKAATVFGNVAAFRTNGARGARGRTAVVVEANLFERAARVAKSYANSALEKMEDPEKLLDQVMNEMTEDLIKMRQASAQVMASQKQLEAKYKQAQATSDDWYKRAQLALQKEDEELAREALKRRKTFQEQADNLEVQYKAQKKATDDLIANTRLLEEKIAEAKSKKDTLKARAKAAQASKQASELIGSVGTNNSMAAFDRMSEKVDMLEAQAEATQQMAGGGAIEDQFKALEAGSVDDELAMMKKAIKGDVDSKVKAIEDKTSKVTSDIDAELEALRKKAKEL